jgi:hypothetical protein
MSQSQFDAAACIRACCPLMERTPDAGNGPSHSASAMKPKQPLWWRMYFQKHMTEIVRRIGYDELPLEIAKERLRPLLADYGQALIEEAAAELLTIDDGQPPIARLTAEARKLAIQILGWPPEAAPSTPGLPPPPEATNPPSAATEAPSSARPQKRRSESVPKPAASRKRRNAEPGSQHPVEP